tara:strand:- start:18 stop:575 length:558 start_codon:yes stop_codon:yes gene_type:complete
MPTVIIRPTSTTSQSGWNQSNIHTLIGDNNNATGVTQNSTTCNFTGELDNLDAALNTATINNFTITLRAVAGRSGASTVNLNAIDSGGSSYSGENKSYTGLTTTQTTSAITTQVDGSALTPTYINNLSVKIEPNIQGTTAYELFLTIDYTAQASYTTASIKGISPANILKINGVSKNNVEKVVGV